MATKKQVPETKRFVESLLEQRLETKRFVESLLEQRLKELADAQVRGDRQAILNAAGSVRVFSDFLKLLDEEESAASG